MEFDNAEVERKVEKIKGFLTKTVPDIDGSIRLLEKCNRPTINEIKSRLAKINPSFFVTLSDDIIIFDDLVQLDRAGVDLILKRIDPEAIGLALRVGSPALQQTFLQSVAKDDAELIRGVLDGPPQKRGHVDAAIDKIMCVVRPLAKEGVVKIIGGAVNASEDLLV